MFVITGIRVFKQFILSILFLTVSLFFFHTYSFAQVPVEPKDLEIDPNALKEASPAALQNFLKDKNQSQKTPGEDIHKKRIAGLKNENKIAKDSTLRDNFINRVNEAEAVYGNSLFSNAAVMELSELSTPPLDYPIGVGDHIVVSLWGGADFELDYEVARDGTIFPSGLGKITVQGLTFDNVRSMVIDRFRRVTPTSTNISVTMGQPRTIVVNVSGEVNKPGPVVVSAFTNALNVVALAGGLTNFSDLRNIIIKRSGRIIDSLDVYKYLTRGDFGSHLYLENNDFVIIGIYDKMVLASGQFKRPMNYQLKNSEGMLDLLKYTGGFTPDAYASGGIIIRNVDEKQTIKNVNFNALGLKAGNKITDEELFNGDIVVVNPINPGLSNKVIIKGEVAYPNVYELRKGDRLFDVINRAGGIRPNAYVDRAYIYKGAGDSATLQSQKIDVSLLDLNRNNYSPNNILLGPNDVIEILNNNNFTDKEFVSIEGEVRTPGRFQRYGGMSLKDLILFANGLKLSAEFGRIEVSSIVDIDSAQKGLKPTRTLIRTYNILPNLELDSLTGTILLRPYDQVFVRKNPTFELQQNVVLEGQVKYPGTYSRLKKNETLSSYITRAGGVKENGNVAGAILFRTRNIGIRQFSRPEGTRYIRDSTGRIIDSVVFDKSEPVSIDLYRALLYKNSKYDLVLQEDDIIFIPEINPIVSVKGVVQLPLKIFFDREHTNLMYYIDKAGGFSVRPWRKRIFVTYGNGRSKRTKNFGFFHFYPKVEQGSIVIVPLRPENKGVVDFASQVLVSAVPIIIATIIRALIIYL